MITSHILDTAQGAPAAGVEVTLEFLRENDTWLALSKTSTNANGRITEFPGLDKLEIGTYRLHFATAPYFAKARQKSFFPHITITFSVEAVHEHYHVPLLLSPFGYSTYRGS